MHFFVPFSVIPLMMTSSLTLKQFINKKDDQTCLGNLTHNDLAVLL
jgi:hypothetical protein